MNFRCSRSSLDNYILLYYRRLAIKVYLHKRTFNIELSVLFCVKKTGGVKMEESVTLKLGRYAALRDKAIRVDVVEKENRRLKKELAIAHKQLEELQQPVEEESTCEERIVNPKEPSEDSKEKLRARYPEGVTVISVDDLKKSILLCDKGIYSVEDKEEGRHVGTIEKPSEVSELEKVVYDIAKEMTELKAELRQEKLNKVVPEVDMKPIEGSKLRRGKHYAKGGVTTKSELADQSPFPMLKRSKKNK